MKVFFDSNVYISDAILGGRASQAITATLKARWKVFVSPTILTEVDRIIRTKFNRSRSFANATIQALRDTSEMAVEPLSRYQVPGDPDDTPILRAAVHAGVDYLVTGDAKILALNRIEGCGLFPSASISTCWNLMASFEPWRP